MITRVKDLQEALAKFDPEARLSSEVKISGYATATCLMENSLTQEDFDNLKEEIEGLELENKSFLTAIRDIEHELENDKPDAEEIKTIIKDLNL